MKTFNILKKNRKYFAAETESGYPCKILIDSNSESLKPGNHALAVDDISIRSKYGTDLIFKLKCSAASQAAAGICSLRTTNFNSVLASRCRELGGKWDPDQKAWIFNGILSDAVEELDDIYNSELITLELIAKNDVAEGQGPVEFLGFTLARAFGRDSGAKLGDGVALISGKICSGGSMKNWLTIIREGSVLRLQAPEKLLQTSEANDEFEVNIIPH